jgi:hypothetical protein
LAASSAAHGEPTVESLRGAGEALAKTGRYTEAIDKFKAADRIAPSATNACLIALAYIRREAWPQAEIFLAQCSERASSSDSPQWVPLAEQQLVERLAAIDVAAVTIEVVPAVPAQLTVSSFAPDETFAPRTIHLSRGHHVVLATAPGLEGRGEIEIDDKQPRHLVVRLHKPGEPARRRSSAPWYVIGAGGALGVTGAALHLFVYKPALDRLHQDSQANNHPQYLHDEPAWATSLAATIATYGAAAIAVGVGVTLRYTIFKERRDAPAIGFAPGRGGGIVSVEWSR